MRAVQKRWAEASELAQAAVDADRSDADAWRLLGTSLFLQDDRRGALQAWNEAGEPRLDTLQIDGLRRTRAPVASVRLASKPGDRVTPGSVLHVERRLDAIPSISRAQVEYVPRPGGLADMRARVTGSDAVAQGAGFDRRRWRAPVIFNRDPQSADQLAHRRRGAVRLSWRFQEQRPRVTAQFTAPAPWGGVWGVAADWERQPFRVTGIPDRGTDLGRHAAWERLAVALLAALGARRRRAWVSRESALATAGVGVHSLTAG